MHDPSSSTDPGTLAETDREPRVLVLDDDPGVCSWIATALEIAGCRVESLTDPAALAEHLRSFAPHVVVTDVRLPGQTSGFDVMAAAHAHDPLVSVVLVSGFASVDDAVRAMQAGAEHYLTKPVLQDDLLRVIDRALERQRVRRAATGRGGLRARDGSSGPPSHAATRGLIGQSDAMNLLRERIELVGPARTTVLITGETGTGKERVAEAIHAASPRAAQPLVRVHCAALPETLLESELFGHEKGSFTGAVARRTGRFEQAHRGTLFLDEVGEIPPGVQVKLLRVLQERSFERVGGNETLTVDVRIITATNRDLRAMVAAGTFRDDLYHRLAVMDIEVPPLRARRDDVPLLVEHALARLSAQLGVPMPTVTHEALRVLTRYDWPGNVRELENVLERALVLSRGAPITAAELSLRVLPRGGVRDGSPQIPGATFAELERHAILTTYEACGHNVTRTAEVLGLSPRTIHYRLREYRGEMGRRRASFEPGLTPSIKPRDPSSSSSSS